MRSPCGGVVAVVAAALDGGGCHHAAVAGVGEFIGRVGVCGLGGGELEPGAFGVVGECPTAPARPGWTLVWLCCEPSMVRR